MTNLSEYIDDRDLRQIAEKVFSGTRITPGEGLLLYEKAEPATLALLAGIVRRRKNGNNTCFNRNFHIEPTNICIYNCRFCSYHRPRGDKLAWELSIDEMLETVRKFDGKPVTEVHIVGGVHPLHNLNYYAGLIRRIKEHRPALHIKAFSAIELDYMVEKSG